MAVSARLSRTLHQRLGDEAAQDLVNWMGQVESNRSELRELMEQYTARTESRFAEWDGRLDTRFAQADARMEARFAQMEIRFERRFGDLLKWSFVFWCGAVGAIAALARVLR